MDVSDWRSPLQLESRQIMVNKILETLKTHVPFCSQEGLNELEQIAVRFEEKIFTAATSQSDYLRKISLKMIAMETKPQNPIVSFLPSIAVGNGKNPSNTGNFISERWLRAVKSEFDDLGVEAKDVSYTSLVVRHNNLVQLASNVIETAVVSEEASEVLRESLESAHEKIKLMYANEDGGLSTTDVISSQVVFNEPHQVGAKGYRKRLNEITEKKRKKSNFPKQNHMSSPCENNVYGVDMDENDEDDDDDDDDLFYTASLDNTAQTGHVEDGDWQEEVYLKIKTMKEMYLPELNTMNQKIAVKLQQHDSLPQQSKTVQLEKLKLFKTMLERIITYLQVSKSNITLSYKLKLGSYEKQIFNFLNTNRPRKPVSSMQQGQLPPPHMHSLQQSQQAQSHSIQVQPHENQTDPQLQAMNLQGFVSKKQQNNITNMQHGPMSSLSVVPNAQKNMMYSLQSGSSLDSGKTNAMSSLQQVAVRSLQQNPVNASNQTTMNTLSSQGGVNVLQPSINNLQSNSNMLQPQLHLKQQQEQHMMQAQLKFQQQRNQQPVVAETANTATTGESAAANKVTNN